MHKFKVGDKVKSENTGYSLMKRLRLGIVREIRSDTLYGVEVVDHEGDREANWGIQAWNFTEKELELIGGEGEPMSKYFELKARIGALNAGWNKEADDILMELWRSRGEGCYHFFPQITISIWNDTAGHVRIMADSKELKDFVYGSQCEKMAAFKQALLWLLDQGNIKKEESIVGKEVKADIEGKIYKVKVLSED